MISDAFIIAIGSAEEKVKKVLNVSTVYVFRTYGKKCLAFAMFILSQSEDIREPTSVAVYAGHREEISYVTSLPYMYIESKLCNITKKDIKRVIVLDMYNPPCTTVVEYICSLRHILEKEDVLAEIDDEEMLNILDGIELYKEFNENSYAYLILNYRGIDPDIISKCVICMVFSREFLLDRITRSEFIRNINSIKEKIKIIDISQEV